MTAKGNLIEKLDVNERYFGEIIYDNGDGIIGGEYRNGEKLVEKINEIIDYLTQPPTSPAVKGADELVEKRTKAEGVVAKSGYILVDEFISDLKSLKQTSVAVKDSQPKEVKISEKNNPTLHEEMGGRYVDCPKCGKTNCGTAIDRFCPGCGVKIKWIA